MLEYSRTIEKYIPIGRSYDCPGKICCPYVMERFQDEKEAKEKADLDKRVERAACRAAEKEEREEKLRLLELEERDTKEA